VGAGAEIGHELVLNPPDESDIFPVSGYTIGYVRDLSHGNGDDIGLAPIYDQHQPDKPDRHHGDDPVTPSIFCASVHRCMSRPHEHAGRRRNGK
jgi:hypothetical protein